MRIFGANVAVLPFLGGFSMMCLGMARVLELDEFLGPLQEFPLPMFRWSFVALGLVGMFFAFIEGEAVPGAKKQSADKTTNF
jgi:hypothetical protein